MVTVAVCILFCIFAGLKVTVEFVVALPVKRSITFDDDNDGDDIDVDGASIAGNGDDITIRFDASDTDE